MDDADEESAETATVTATHGGTAVGSATLTIRASDIPSDDASLASLVLSDVDIGTFSPEATDYAAQVPTELSSTTVTVAANDAGAVLEIADAVGSTLGETRTVRLEEGDNAITVTVTAEDGATTRAYRVAVARAYAAAWGERLPQRDIELGARAGPTGLWSDGETLWVIWDWRSGAVRAYDLDDGSLLAERGFEVAGGSGFPSGLWSDGTTLWVSDFYGGVTAHRLSDGTRLPAEDLDGDILAAAGNSGPSGLWSDGTTLWVADDQVVEGVRVPAVGQVAAGVAGGRLPWRRRSGEPVGAVVGRRDAAGVGPAAGHAARLPAVGRRPAGGARGGPLDGGHEHADGPVVGR